MRICIVAEGCYPYVVGGVSSWIHSMIKIFPEYQFVVLAIVANRSLRGKFVYDLPENVVEVHELYLEDADWRPKELKRAARLKLNEREYAALRSLLMNQNVDWDTLFSFFGEKEFSLNELLMGEDFFRAVQECYTVRYAGAVFSDFLWTMRSMYLPLFLTHAAAEGGCVSLCGDGICGRAGQHGKAQVWLQASDLGAWNLHQGARGRTDPCGLGVRHL